MTHPSSNTQRKDKHRLTLILVLLLAGSFAKAQLPPTSSTSGVLAQGRLCLDLAGHFSAANPPANGTRVVAGPCSGRASQRWVHHDLEYLSAVGGRRLVLGFRGEHGETLNVGGTYNWPGVGAPNYDRRSHTIADQSGSLSESPRPNRCVTRHGINIFLRPCDGSAEQRWEMR